jgi:hypothetical protein
MILARRGKREVRKAEERGKLTRTLLGQGRRREEEEKNTTEPARDLAGFYMCVVCKNKSRDGK